MQASNQKRYYSPQFSALAAVSVRRLAWFLGITMPKAVDIIVSILPEIFLPSTVCPKCKDNTKCSLCAFYQPSPVNTTTEKAGTGNAA